MFTLQCLVGLIIFYAVIVIYVYKRVYKPFRLSRVQKAKRKGRDVEIMRMWDEKDWGVR